MQKIKKRKMKKIFIIYLIGFFIFTFTMMYINLSSGVINYKNIKELEENYSKEYNTLSEQEKANLEETSVEEYSKQKAKEMQNKILVICIPLVFIVSAIGTLVFNLLLIILWIAMSISEKKLKKEKMDKIDKKNTDFYYRDIIEKYSICELSYIDDFKIEETKDLIAELLYMQNKKMISINADKIVINANIELDNVNPIQVYILKHIKDGKLKNINIYELQEKTKMQLVKNKLLEEKDNIEKRTAKKIVKTIIIFVLLFVIYNILNTFEDYDNLIINAISYSIFIILIIYPTYGFFSILADIIKFKTDPLYRTRQGKELNKKIEGLKKYIKEYSMLENRTASDLTIWEDYLIYSVAFGQNDNILGQYKKYIEN